MVKVAIAGGNGAVGQTIARCLNGGHTHEGVILTRKNNTSDSSSSLPTVTVDYNDIESLRATLEAHEINTVITTFAINGSSLRVSQINLIRAAASCSTTKRFIPSSFAIPYSREFVDILPPLKDYFASIDLLRTTSLEWTIFHNGIFLDYFATPHIETYLKPNTFAIDMHHHMAALPGDGNTPVTFTYTYDLARFIVASLDLPQWPEESRVIGDTVTWNEFIELAEGITGYKFDVVFDSREKLEQGEITELPSHLELYSSFPKASFQQFMAIFELWTTDGTSHIAYEGSLNQKFPEITTLGVKEMLRQYWETQ